MPSLPHRLTAAAIAVIVSGGTVLAGAASPSAPVTEGPATDPVLAAAGDIACDPGNPFFRRGRGTSFACRQRRTARIIGRIDPDAVLTLGDNQYDHGRRRAFRRSYHRSWGAFRDITHPSPGNHDYETRRARGYFGYFGDRAGPGKRGYYSFDLGTWHVVSLNSNCWATRGCDEGDPQYEWLEQDLQADPAGCTLAYWHHPRWSSGPHGNSSLMGDVMRLLDAANADVVLAGHDHLYERFTPLEPNGTANPVDGIRTFVVGTGGAELYSVRERHPSSEVRRRLFGVLELTLRDGSYEWRFRTVGDGVRDQGTDTCH
jgi:hypothetical protein